MKKIIVRVTHPKHAPRYEYEVWIISGVQSFRLDYRGTHRACKWYAKQLRHALKP